MSILADVLLNTFDFGPKITWDTHGAEVAIARFSADEVQVGVRFTKMSHSQWQVGVTVGALGQDAIPVVQTSLWASSGAFQAVREFLEVRQPARLTFANGARGLGDLLGSCLQREGTELRRMGFRIEGPANSSGLGEVAIIKMTPSEWCDFGGGSSA
jgi:hypothetical protein